MVGPASRRRAVKHVVETGLGKPAQACRALGLARSTFYHAPRPGTTGRKLRREIIALSQKHPRYGYRLITTLLRRAGRQVTRRGKRVYTVLTFLALFYMQGRLNPSENAYVTSKSLRSGATTHRLNATFPAKRYPAECEA